MYGRIMQFSINNGEIIKLRPFYTEQDWTSNLENMSKHSVMQYMDIGPFGKVEASAKELYSAFANSDSTVIWAIEAVKHKEIIGYLNFWQYSRIYRTANQSFVIWNNSYWNKGIISKAVLAQLLYAVDVLNLIALRAYVFAENKASIKTFEKYGYYKYGTLPAYHYVNAKYHDSYHYVWYNPLEADKTINKSQYKSQINNLDKMQKALELARKEIILV